MLSTPSFLETAAARHITCLRISPPAYLAPIPPFMDDHVLVSTGTSSQPALGNAPNT